MANTTQTANDVRLFFGDQEVGQVQTFTVNRDYAPVYEIGSTEEVYRVFGRPGGYSGTLTLQPTLDDWEELHGENIDKLFKSVRMKKNLSNEDYSALLNEGELF
jgi:hypothetical protein